MMSEWISVEDELPKDGQSVLVHDNIAPGSPSGTADKCWAGNTAVAVYYDDEYGERWSVYMNMVQDPRLHFDPTHWQPLPAPPETP